jgi:hypothetical protein
MEASSVSSAFPDSADAAANNAAAVLILKASISWR